LAGVALLTDEKIPFAGGPEANLYLVETPDNYTGTQQLLFQWLT